MTGTDSSDRWGRVFAEGVVLRVADELGVDLEALVREGQEQLGLPVTGRLYDLPDDHLAAIWVALALLRGQRKALSRAKGYSLNLNGKE